MTKENAKKAYPPRREAPQVAIEWIDLKIDIKVCGVDLPPEERGFTRLFPTFDPSLLSSDVLDQRRAAQKKRRKEERAGRYTYLPLGETGSSPSPGESSVEGPVKVLPKLTCQHCGKNFSRRSTLEQHLVIHSSNSGGQSWLEVQDAAIKDLEQAIAFSSLDNNMPGAPGVPGVPGAPPRRGPGQPGEEEEEISPPPGVKEEPGEEDGSKTLAPPENGIRHRCSYCNKSFSRLSLLNRHMKLHSGVKPYSCNICGWRFLQRYNLKKHLMTHSGVKPNKCGECEASFTDGHQLRNHVIKHHNQGSPELLENHLEDDVPVGDLQASLENGSIGTGGGPVQCPKCDRTFAAKGHLERHMPVHTSTMVKPYSCVVCGWRFHLLHNMQRHLATHKGTGAGANGEIKTEGDHSSPKLEAEEIKTEIDPEDLGLSLGDH